MRQIVTTSSFFVFALLARLAVFQTFFANKDMKSYASINLNHRTLRFLDEHVNSSIVVTPIAMVSTMCQTNSLDYTANLVNSDGFAWAVALKIIEKAEIMQMYSQLCQHDSSLTLLEALMKSINHRQNPSEVLLWRSLESSRLELDEFRISIFNEKFQAHMTQAEREETLKRVQASINCGAKLAILDSSRQKLILRHYNLQDDVVFKVLALQLAPAQEGRLASSVVFKPQTAGEVDISPEDRLLILYDGQNGKNLPLNIVDFLVNCYLRMISFNLARNGGALVLGHVRMLFEKILIPVLRYLKNKLNDEDLQFENLVNGEEFFAIDPAEVSKLRFLDLMKSNSPAYKQFRQSQFTVAVSELEAVLAQVDPDELNKFLHLSLDLLRQKKLLFSTKFTKRVRTNDTTTLVALKISNRPQIQFQSLLEKIIHNKINDYTFWIESERKKRNYLYLISQPAQDFEDDRSGSLDIDDDLSESQLDEMSSSEVEQRAERVTRDLPIMYTSIDVAQPSLRLHSIKSKRDKNRTESLDVIENVLPGANSIEEVDKLSLKSAFAEIPIQNLKEEIKIKMHKRKKFAMSMKTRNQLKSLKVDISSLNESEQSVPVEACIRKIIDKTATRETKSNHVRILAADEVSRQRTSSKGSLLRRSRRLDSVNPVGALRSLSRGTSAYELI